VQISSSRTHQDSSQNSLSITASHKAFVTSVLSWASWINGLFVAKDMAKSEIRAETAGWLAAANAAQRLSRKVHSATIRPRHPRESTPTHIATT
jgi:hypothetical protein